MGRRALAARQSHSRGRHHRQPAIGVMARVDWGGMPVWWWEGPPVVGRRALAARQSHSRGRHHRQPAIGVMARVDGGGCMFGQRGGVVQRREGRVSVGMVGIALARRVVDAWRGATWWFCGEGCQVSTPKRGYSCRRCSPVGIEKLIRLRPLSQNVGDLLVLLPHDCSHPCGVNVVAMVGSSPLLSIGLLRSGLEVTAILRIGAPNRIGTTEYA